MRRVQKGQSIVELLLVISLTSIILPALVTSLISSREGKAQQYQRLEATALLKEAEEAVRSIREKGWNTFAINGIYHPEILDNSWVLAPNEEIINGLNRKIEITDAYRDSSGSLVTSGGSPDPSTKRVILTVSWDTPSASSVQSTLYLTRYLNNISYTESTEAEFSVGTLQSVEVTNESGGEVILAGGGHGDWCRPSDFIVASLDLPQSGAARDVKAIEGKAFTGTNNSITGTFVEIDITDDDPPVPSINSVIDGYETNDVFIDENYAYIATDDVNKDVVIIDLNTNQEVGFFDDDYWFGTAQGISVKDNVGYVTIGLFLHSFDLSSKIGERPELDTVFLWGTGYRHQVVGNYSYVAVDWGWSELRIIDISNPNDLKIVASADVNGERGQEVFVNEDGTRAYLATNLSSSKSELFIINTENKSGYLPIVSEYDANGMDPRGITVIAEDNIAVLVGIGGEEYQVIDISNETSLFRCGGIQVDSGIYGVSSVVEQDTDAYSYIVTGDSNGEFKIIEGGPGTRFEDSGIFESSTFDAGFQVAFNRFDVTVDKPTQTDITFQIAVADPVSGTCDGASFAFVGPDGTDATFFDQGDTIPVNDDGIGFENPGQCFRYKAYLSTTDPLATPVFYDISINYSP